MSNQNGALPSDRAVAPSASNPQAVSPVPASIPSAARLITTNELAGYLACWAVRQSPYGCPEGLENAVTDFRAHWPHDPELPVMPCLYWESLNDLRKAVTEACEMIPSIAIWNQPKSGHGSAFVFSSRYDQPNPDDDFIDLDALGNNIARSAWAEATEAMEFDASVEAAIAIEAGTDETHSGSARQGESAGRNGIAQPEQPA